MLQYTGRRIALRTLCTVPIQILDARCFGLKGPQKLYEVLLLLLRSFVPSIKIEEFDGVLQLQQRSSCI